MPIKTRAEIYRMEAADLLREISLYPGITEEQLCRFHPGKEEKVKTLLSNLQKQGRIEMDESCRFIPKGGFTSNVDLSMVKAVWVLLDFIDRVEYHSAHDFPVKIVFFAADEEFEIIYVPYGKEGLVSQTMRMRQEMIPKRIVLVDEPSQISALDFPGISAFCTVADNGRVSYFKKRQGGNH